MPENVLTISHITKHFAGLAAVSDVNIEVQKGEIYGLIGPNGAGKTTIFNLITGVYKLTEGEIFFGDTLISRGETTGIDHTKADLFCYKPYQIADMGITRTFQNIRLFKELTVRENVLTACHRSANYSILDTLFRWKIGSFEPKFYKQEKELSQKTDDLLNLMSLYRYRDMKASNLPYGLQRKLEIARALAMDPSLLLLDEPAAGMNPEETESLMELVHDIRKQFDLTVLIIEHHMDLIMGVCDRMTVLNFGKQLMVGTPEEVQNNPEVIEAYLGNLNKGEEKEA